MAHMAKVKLTTPSKMVWRISEERPMGEWVDSGLLLSPRSSQENSSKVARDSWVTSSYDLLRGTDIIEVGDTVPGELFDQLFGATPSPVKPSGE